MTAPNLTGRRVRGTWPDGTVTDASGAVCHVAPCKAYPEVWPLAEWCGYTLPTAAERVPAVIGCGVLWDADYRDSGDLVARPDYAVRSTWVPDAARCLADEQGQPLEVPPLVEYLSVKGMYL